jgi:hypothetical protein
MQLLVWFLTDTNPAKAPHHKTNKKEKKKK